MNILLLQIYSKTISHPNAGWHIFNTLEVVLGDINGDNILNILDIVLIVNILSNEYSLIADANEDESIDVLDVILIVNILLDI